MTKAREERVSIDRAKSELAELILSIEASGDVLMIERDGKESAALLSADAYRRLLHTLELLQAAGEGLTDIAAGRTGSWDDLRDELLARVEESKQVKRA
ncbi:MAG: Antitoxin RelB [Planctomycetes bacterium]|nr:Antitoxin RelB [Planctomycetota bacterium]